MKRSKRVTKRQHKENRLLGWIDEQGPLKADKITVHVPGPFVLIRMDNVEAALTPEQAASLAGGIFESAKKAARNREALSTVIMPNPRPTLVTSEKRIEEIKSALEADSREALHTMASDALLVGQ